MRKLHTQALAKQDLNMWLYSFKNWGEKQADCYFEIKQIRQWERSANGDSDEYS